MQTTTSTRRVFLLATAGLLLGAISGWRPATAAAAPLKITVYGGTGNIGQRIVSEALGRGHSVTVVARTPRAAAQENPRLKIVQGDVLDTAGVAKQITGQDVVITAVRAGRGPDDKPAEFYAQVARSIVSAQRQLANRAPRVIITGGASTLLDANGKPLADSPEFARVPKGELLGQRAALEYLRTVSDTQWSYFSPAGSIANGVRTGKFRLGDEHIVRDASGASRISTEDFAVAMLDEAEQPKQIRKHFTIGY